MFTLAHLSDLHMALQPRLIELVGKRGLGFINWHRKRKHIHRRDVLDDITRDLKAQPADHIAVTGDLVNLSLPIEYARARDWLETIGSPHNVTVIPGNHDVYVRRVEEAPAEYWGDYMTGDDGLKRFPFLRRRNGTALIALSSGVATGPFMATGRLGERQLAQLAEILEQTRDAFRIVLIHHPPLEPGKASSAPPDRRAGFPLCAGHQGRRAFAARSRSSARAHLARRARQKDSCRSACRRPLPMRRTATKTAPAIISSPSTAEAETGAAR